MATAETPKPLGSDATRDGGYEGWSWEGLVEARLWGAFRSARGPRRSPSACSEIPREKNALSGVSSHGWEPLGEAAWGQGQHSRQHCDTAAPLALDVWRRTMNDEDTAPRGVFFETSFNA